MFSDGDQYDKKYIEKLLYFRLSYEQNCPGYTMRENHDEYLVNLYDKGIVNRDDKYASDLPANIAELIQSLDYQVYLIEDYMTDDIAKLIAPIKNLYYISDIRSNSTEDTGPSNLDVMWNNAMQYNWIKIMSPKKYMIKFRCPYEHNYNKVAQEYNGRSYMKEAFDNCAIPFLDNEKNKKFEYLDGDIYIQAFAGPTSTETRIIGDSLKVKEYNIYDYEDKIFCYNRTYRSLGWFTSHEKYLNKYPVLCEDIGIDRCGDCARMCHIFEQYLDKYPSISESPVHMTQNLLSWIDRSIKTGGHGIYHTQYKNRDDFMSKIPFNLNYFKLRKLFRKPLSGNMGLNLAWKYLNMERPLFNLTDLYDREVCDQYYDELPNNYDVKRKDNVIMTTDEKIVLPTQITSDQDAIDYALGRNAAKYDKFHKLEELFADGVEITTSKSSAMSSDNYPKQFLTNRNIFHTNSRCILVTIQIFTEDYLMYYLEVLQRLRKPILMITYQTTQFIKRANNNLISYKMSNVDDALRKQILEIIEN
jgi:hypothetical protein